MNPTQLRELLAAHDLHPSKALGQHFLADANTADRIVRLAGVEPGTSTDEEDASSQQRHPEDEDKPLESASMMDWEPPIPSDELDEHETASVDAPPKHDDAHARH